MKKRYNLCNGSRVSIDLFFISRGKKIGEVVTLYQRTVTLVQKYHTWTKNHEYIIQNSMFSVGFKAYEAGDMSRTVRLMAFSNYTVKGNENSNHN